MKSLLFAIGAMGTCYEVDGPRLFIDGLEVSPSDGDEWGSVDAAKNAADSAEIATAHNDGLAGDAWKRGKP